MDFSALALASSVLALLLALVLGLALRRVPDSDGAHLWALAFVPLSAGLALQRLEFDATLVLVLHDPLVLAGFALLLAGLRQFLRLPRIWLLSGIIVLASLLASALFTAVWPLPELRHALRLTGMALLCLGCLTTLRELREPALRPVGLFLQAVFGLLALLSVLRLGLLVPPPSALLALLEEAAWMGQAALLLAALIGLMLLLTARMNLALERLSMHDGLTGVLNRRSFDEAAHTTLSLARRLGRPVGLLLCEPSPVEAPDALRGPHRHDEILPVFAARLQQQFDGADLIGRIGGTFAVLLPGADAHEALQAAEGLRERVASEPVLLDGRPVALLASIGVLSQPGIDAVWPAMLAGADAALREARARGRNACVLAGGGRQEASPESPMPAGAASA